MNTRASNQENENMSGNQPSNDLKTLNNATNPSVADINLFVGIDIICRSCEL